MFTYTKISKYLSAKYYQDYKERLQKKKNFWKTSVFPNKKKSDNMDLNNIRICLKVKIKSWLSIEKKIIKYGNNMEWLMISYMKNKIAIFIKHLKWSLKKERRNVK